MNYKFIMEISWKRNTTEGDSPVHEINLLSSSILSRTEHVKFCLNLPGPSGKANTKERPIVNKYREGKVKSTPNRRVK